jgi:hypothetical protein
MMKSHLKISFCEFKVMGLSSFLISMGLSSNIFYYYQKYSVPYLDLGLSGSGHDHTIKPFFPLYKKIYMHDSHNFVDHFIPS